MEILNKTFKLIDDIIEETNVKNIDFYENVLEMMSSLFNDSLIAIYFCEDTQYVLKSAIENKKKIDIIDAINNNEIYDFINSSNKSAVLNKNTFLVKLSIKNSIFGFGLLKTKELTQNTKTAFESVINVLSYKIKDYELNEVFKIQLKAMQEAIIEKENAYEIIKKQHKKLQELDKTKNLFLFLQLPN